MIFNSNDIVEMKGGVKFVVLDIKEYEGKEVALVQSLTDAVLRFAVEELDAKEKTAKLIFIEDQELINAIATEFDRQDGKL